ncbi:MAG: amidohydrolase, partial [Hyphomonas sp.]|nr:amidohydrolase [Hyphomonas sp.]
MMRTLYGLAAACATALLLTACGGGDEAGTKAPAEAAFNKDPYPSTYAPYPNAPVLITNATILDGEGNLIEDGSLLLQDGKIVAIGADIEAPEGAETIDATGRWVTPGIIDN